MRGELPCSVDAMVPLSLCLQTRTTSSSPFCVYFANLFRAASDRPVNVTAISMSLAVSRL